MREQHRFSFTFPLPSALPPHLFLAWLQSYIPTLDHNISIAQYTEIPSLPNSIANDLFIGPFDETVRTYHVLERYELVPGLIAPQQWPAVYRRVPNGVRLRVSAPNGNVIRSQWTVRPRRDTPSPSPASSEGSSGSSEATQVGEEWELFDEGMLEGHRLRMAFSSRYINMIHQHLSQSLVDEGFKAYMNGTMPGALP